MDEGLIVGELVAMAQQTAGVACPTCAAPWGIRLLAIAGPDELGRFDALLRLFCPACASLAGFRVNFGVRAGEEGGVRRLQRRLVRRAGGGLLLAGRDGPDVDERAEWAASERDAPRWDAPGWEPPAWDAPGRGYGAPHGAAGAPRPTGGAGGGRRPRDGGPITAADVAAIRAALAAPFREFLAGLGPR